MQSGVNELTTISDHSPWILLPKPRECRTSGALLTLHSDRLICLRQGDRDALIKAGQILRSSLRDIDIDWELSAIGRDDDFRTGAILEIDPGLIEHPQGYRLTIQTTRIQLVARDPAGLFYGMQTLSQIIRQQDRTVGLPVLTINDWPDFPERGFLLDISRGKVPTMDTLYRLVDLMASIKLNQLQLYTEAAFAYRDHEVVWQGTDPMTGQQVMELDAYCRRKYIELVPNQNTFAHMERWTKHEPYSRLAEIPGGSTLCPIDAGSIELVGNLLDELLPHFSSQQVNVCCDEAAEVGMGRSKQVVERLGYGRVYLDYIQQVHHVVQRNGRKMQMWADMILAYPELIPQIASDITLLVWYYEDEHPYFRDNLPKLENAGLRFYVCPGTSSWLSLLGRTKNALTNLEEAARYGRQHGAVGYLICNWGALGVWEHLPINYLPMAYGAAVSWSYESNQAIDLPRSLDRHVFRDEAAVMGQIVYDLGNAYQQTGVYMQDGTPMGNVIYYAVFAPEYTDKWYRNGELKIEGCERALGWIDHTLARLPQVRMKNPESDLIVAELRNDADLFRHAVLLQIELLKTQSLQIKDVPKATRENLACDMLRIIPELQRLWLARNRPGGLEASLNIAESLVALYREEGASK